MNSLNKEQKSGILFLLTSKTFESLAYYLVVAILLDFLCASLKIELGKTGIYYTIWAGTYAITAIIAAFLGDKFNRVQIVKIGFMLTTIFYLVLAFLPGIPFLIAAALVLLGVGIGMTMLNTRILLGNIYNEKGNEIRGLSGFILYGLAINIGGLFAPQLAVFLKTEWGYNSVFLFAFILGLLSWILYLKFKSQYQKLELVAEQKENSETADTQKLHRLILFSILTIGVFIFFAVSQKEVSYQLSANNLLQNGSHLSQELSRVGMFIAIVLTALFAYSVLSIKNWDWGKLFNLILIGVAFAVISSLFMITLTSLSPINGNSLYSIAYILILIAETLIAPVILYIVYRSSPLRHKGLFQGIFFLLGGLVNLLLYGGFYLSSENAVLTFVLFGIILIIAAVLILLLKKRVNDTVVEIEKDGEEVLVEGEV